MNPTSSTCSNQENQSKNIGLFGASFNPPHHGHLAVVQDLSTRGIFDEIWLVPVFEHAFGKTLAPFENRLDMLKILLTLIGRSNVHINTIERELNLKPTYSFDMVSALKQHHPTYQFNLIVGSDIKPDLHKWHRIEDLKQIANFYFIPRQGFENSHYPQVSSSEIRQLLQQSADIAHLVPAKIADYIVRHKLYQI